MTISEKTKQIAILKRAHDKRIADLTAQHQQAKLFDKKCDLVAEMIEEIRVYYDQVSEICHGKR